MNRDYEMNDSVRKAFVDQQKGILYKYVHVSNDDEMPRIRFTSYASRQVKFKITCYHKNMNLFEFSLSTTSGTHIF